MESFFLRNKRSIVVIFGIFCVRKETRMNMCSITSSDSALLSEKHGVWWCRNDALPFNLDFIKCVMYLAGFICV